MFIGSRRTLLKPRTVAASGTWTSVWTPSGGMPNNDAGYGGYTVVDVFAIGEFSATGGTKMRFTLKGPPTGVEGTAIAAMYVYDGSGTDTYDFGGTPTQVFVGGSGSFTLANGSTNTVTDEINFGKAASGNLVVSWHLTDSANDDMARDFSANLASGSSFWYKNAVSEASTANKTGYSDGSGTGHHVISKIELYL